MKALTSYLQEFLLPTQRTVYIEIFCNALVLHEANNVYYKHKRVTTEAALRTLLIDTRKYMNECWAAIHASKPYKTTYIRDIDVIDDNNDIRVLTIRIGDHEADYDKDKDRDTTFSVIAKVEGVPHTRNKEHMTFPIDQELIFVKNPTGHASFTTTSKGKKLALDTFLRMTTYNDAKSKALRRTKKK